MSKNLNQSLGPSGTSCSIKQSDIYLNLINTTVIEPYGRQVYNKVEDNSGKRSLRFIFKWISPTTFK